MDSLPMEIVIEILTMVTYTHPNPIHAACVHSSWAGIIIPILENHLYFTRLSQIKAFYDLTIDRSHAISPITLTFTRSITTTDPELFSHIAKMLARCDNTRLKSVSLALNSHYKGSSAVELALSLINPTKFTWVSPDPSHHFSIAIVAPAANGLARSLPNWTRLQSLTLANMSFEKLACGLNFAQVFSQGTHSCLRSIHIGQAVFMSPSAAIHILLRLPDLELLSLVDVYSTSIWGRRVRNQDIKTAHNNMEHGGDIGGILNEIPRWEDLKKRVECGAERERIIGGDRG